MATTSGRLAFDRGVRPMLEIVLPEGELTEDERTEYAGYVWANKFVAVLKRQAQQIANSPYR